MTDFTGEEMRTIILRSLNANAARMRRKLKRQAARAAATASAATQRNGRATRRCARLRRAVDQVDERAEDGAASEPGGAEVVA